MLGRSPTPYPRPLLHLLRALAVALGAASAGAAMLEQSMNADGINYLDIGDAYMRGDWGTAINGTWSPLYALVLGIVLRVARPSMEWEFRVVHGVNFALFLVALVAFELFWREVSRRYYGAGPSGGAAAGEDGAAAAPYAEGAPDRLPPWAFLSVGYGLFIWSSTALIAIYAVTPDMIVAAAAYAAGGLLLRIAGGDVGWRTFAAFGAVLGVGYLAKAAMFPLAFVFLGLAVLVQEGWRRGAMRAVPALVAFLAVGGPFLAALSAKEGRFTFSDVGKLTYLKHVYEVPFPHYRPGVVDVAGEPLNPLPRIETTPPIYTFAEPVGGTYPLSFDPFHWYDGLVPRVDPRLQLRALAINLRYYFDLFFRLQGAFLGVVVVLALMAGAGGQRPLAAKGWALVVVAAAALGMYSLVHVIGRYIGPFVVLFWTGILLSVRLKPAPANRTWLNASSAAMVLAVAVNIGGFHLDGLNALVGFVPRAGPRGGGLVSGTPAVPAKPPLVARGLAELGLEPGDPVGMIGYSFDAHWARLARLRIVAEIAPEDLEAFWRAEGEAQRQVRQAFAGAGVRAVVMEAPPPQVDLAGWTRVGGTPYYAHLFGPADGS